MGAHLHADVAPRAGLVLDDDALAQQRRKSLGQPARPDVGHTTRTTRYEDANRLGRPRCFFGSGWTMKGGGEADRKQGH